MVVPVNSIRGDACLAFPKPRGCRAMKIIKYLANLGYGSRREVAVMVERKHVRRRDGSVVSEGEPFTHEDIPGDGKPLDRPQGSVVMLNKPVGYVTSTKEASRLVY